MEQHDLIDMLADVQLRRACSAAAGWRGDFTLAFNIPPVQLVGGNLPCRIVDAVSATGFPLSRVEIEVTAGSLISDEEEERAFAVLRDLDALGHKLKVDARFVRKLDTKTGKRRIAAIIVRAYLGSRCDKSMTALKPRPQQTEST